MSLLSSIPKSVIRNNELDLELDIGTPITVTWISGDKSKFQVDYLPEYVKLNPGYKWFVNTITLSGQAINFEIVSIDLSTNKIDLGAFSLPFGAIGDELVLSSPNNVSSNMLMQSPFSDEYYMKAVGVGTWRFSAIDIATVFKHSDGTYYALVNGINTVTTNKWEVGYFTSPDLKTWTVGNSDAPIITTAFKAWTDDGVRLSGNAYWDADNDVFVCGVLGKSSGTGNWAASWITFDEDLTTFTSTTAAKFTSASDIIAADFIKYDGEWHMIDPRRDPISYETNVRHRKSATLDGTYVVVSIIDSEGQYVGNEGVYYERSCRAIALFEEDGKLKCWYGGESAEEKSFNKNAIAFGIITFDDVDTWAFDGMTIVYPYSGGRVSGLDSLFYMENISILNDSGTYYAFFGVGQFAATSFHDGGAYVTMAELFVPPEADNEFLSIANSIRFKDSNALIQAFDNTLEANTVYLNELLKKYCQIYKKETITIQARTDKYQIPGIRIYNDTDGTFIEAQFVLDTAYTDFDIYEYDLDFSAYSDGDQLRALVYIDSLTYEAEPIVVKDYDDEDLTESGLVEIKYNHYESEYGIDYNTGIVNKLYVEAFFRTFEPGGESSIYDNQNEKVKLKEIVYRNLTLQTDEIPRYIAEQIQIAAAHSTLIVNGVEFTAEEQPSINPLGNSNLVTLELVLTQKDHNRLYWD